jgi:hypothetical protein
LVDKKKQFVHTDATEVRPGMPGVDNWGRCGRCHGELEQGFGLAGGGYGPDDYCPKCGEVVNKVNLLDDEA